MVSLFLRLLCILSALTTAAAIGGQLAVSSRWVPNPSHAALLGGGFGSSSLLWSAHPLNIPQALPRTQTLVVQRQLGLVAPPGTDRALGIVSTRLLELDEQRP